MSDQNKEDLVRIRTIEDDKHEIRSVTSYTVEKVKWTCKIGGINGKPMTDDQIKQFEEDWKDPNWVDYWLKIKRTALKTFSMTYFERI